MRPSPVSAGPADSGAQIHLRPLTIELWTAFEDLFGARGGCAGCWCMYWRQPGRLWRERDPETNKSAFMRLVEQGPAPGVLALLDGQAIGWCQVGPRENYARLQASPTKGPMDPHPSWCISCLFIRRQYRGKGLSQTLLRAATDHAFAQGAERIEAWPVDPAKAPAAAFRYTGTVGSFERLGFAPRSGRAGKREWTRHVLERSDPSNVLRAESSERSQ